MEQLSSAGIPAKSEDDTISNESKVKLLEFLRGSHGKEKKSLSPRKKVVLKRKSKEVLRVSSGGSGPAKTKSINIEVKKKKINRWVPVKKKWLRLKKNAWPHKKLWTSAKSS